MASTGAKKAQVKGGGGVVVTEEVVEELGGETAVETQEFTPAEIQSAMLRADGRIRDPADGLPDGVKYEEERLGSGAIYSKYRFQEGGNDVDFYVRSNQLGNSVTFYVNNDVDRGSNISPESGRRIATRVRTVMRHEAKTRPDGFEYTTEASTADGLGATRERLYAAAGFSRAVDPGDTQRAVVRGGRLRPLED